MLKNYWLFLLLIAPTVIKAQYTEIINSSRPGFSESPFSVGTGVFQIEGGYQYYTTDSFIKDEKINSHVFEQVLRMGAFSERLEFKFLFNQEYNKINNPNSIFSSDFGGSAGFGIKYLLLNAKIKNREHEIRSWKKRTGFHWTMLLPSIAIEASTTIGINPTFSEDLNLSPDGFYDVYLGKDFSLYPETVSNTFIQATSFGMHTNPSGNYRFALLLQNQVKEKWVIATNFSFEKRFYTSSFDTNIYNLIVAGTYNMDQNWSFFGESKNQFNTHKNNFDFRAGAAFLLNKDLQFDSSFNFNSGSELKTSGVSVGVSWRIDNHEDKLLKIKHFYSTPPKSPIFTLHIKQ